MTKTYTKFILGAITFLWTLLGPMSVVIKPAELHADSIPTTTKTQVSLVTNIAHAEWISVNDELAITLESFVKVIYVILWPALFIAWLAMDNSLIYWEIFGIDKALFQFWQIMKNFANFALWFIFVWSILKYIFDIQWGKSKNPKDIIINLLLASVLVNTSWFAMWVLVDLSTALTVGIGWLPLQLIWDSTLSKKPLLGTVATIKLNDAIGKKDTAPVFHTWPGANWWGTEKYLLLCYIENGKIDWDEKKRQTTFLISDVAWTTTNTWTRIWWNEVVKDFCVSASNVINKWSYEAAWSPIVYDTSLMQPVFASSLTALEGKTWCANNKACQTMASFANKTEWYQWAFYSLYASLMDLGSIHVWVPKSDTSMSMEAMIKIIITLAYLVPLIILAIVLVMRVWYLWLVIAFSPFIALAIVDIWWIWKKMWWMDGIWKFFNKDNVISLLMMPVVVTFVISLSIVFLWSMSQWLTTNADGSALGIYQRVEGTSYKCYDLAITNICFDIPVKDVGLWISDYFSWVLLNLFGIALMWFAVMTALKQNKITWGIAGSIGSLAQNALMWANFIPIPGSGGKSTSLAGLASIPDSMKTLANQSKERSRDQTSEALMWMISDTKGEDKKVKEAMNITTKAIQEVKNNNPDNAFIEKRKIFQNNLGSTDNFSAQGAMSFGQADGSATFANFLATQAGNTKKFSKWQELFTDPQGQQVLAKWMEWADDATWAKLKAMYSSKTTDEWKWWDIESNIRGIIAQKTAVQLFGETADSPLYIDKNTITVWKALTGNPSPQDIENALTKINELLAKDPTINTNNITDKELTFGMVRVKLSRTNGNPPTIIIEQPASTWEKNDQAKNGTTDNKNQPAANNQNTVSATQQWWQNPAVKTWTPTTANSTPPAQ